MECFAGFLSYTDHQLGRVMGFLADLGELDDTLVVLVSDNGASAEGGPDGSINDIRLENFDPAGTDGVVRPAGRDRRAQHPQQLPLGLDHGREHAVQTVEARGPPGRGGRPLHRALAPTPAGGRRWGAPSVHPRHRRPAHRPGAGRGRAARGDRPRAPVAPRRRELRLPARPRRGRGPRAPRDPALRDADVAGHLPPGLEGGHLPPGGTDLRRRPRAQRPVRRRRLGALPRGRGPLRDRGPGRRPARARGRAGRAVVGRGRAQPGPPARQPRAVDPDRTPSPITAGPATSSATSRAGPRCPRPWP